MNVSIENCDCCVVGYSFQTTAKDIQRQGLGLKSQPIDWRIGLTIAGQNDYCDTITIVKNPIAILLHVLLQLPIAILLR